MDQTDSVRVRTSVLNTDVYMSKADDRLQSFKGRWPKNFFISPLDLATAGFYYTGQGDIVVCFCCDLMLKDWRPTDRVQLEHYRWSSDCAFLRMTFCLGKTNTNTRGREVFNCGCDSI